MLTHLCINTHITELPLIERQQGKKLREILQQESDQCWLVHICIRERRFLNMYKYTHIWLGAEILLKDKQGTG